MQMQVVSEHPLSDEVLAQLVEDQQSGARMVVLSQDGLYRMTLTMSELAMLVGVVEATHVAERQGAK